GVLRGGGAAGGSGGGSESGAPWPEEATAVSIRDEEVTPARTAASSGDSVSELPVAIAARPSWAGELRRPPSARPVCQAKRCSEAADVVASAGSGAGRGYFAAHRQLA